MLVTYLTQQSQVAALVAGRTGLKESLAGRPPDHQPDLPEALRRLHDVQETMPHFLEIAIADPQGKVMTSTVESSIGGSLADRPEFRAGRSASYISRPEVLEGAVRLRLAQPIHGQGADLLGVLTVLLEISPLDQALSSDIGLGQTGEVLVAAQEGDQIVYLFSPRGERRLTVPLAEVPAMAAALAGERGFRPETYEGVPVLAVSAPVTIGAQRKIDGACWPRSISKRRMRRSRHFAERSLRCKAFWCSWESRRRTRSPGD